MGLVGPQNVPWTFSPGAQLTQETAMQKLVDYPDHLVRAADVATVYRNSSGRPFEESWSRGTKLINRCCNMPKTSVADGLRWAFLHLRRYFSSTTCAAKHKSFRS
ncbi:hypothetical protein TNCV_634481 [Trichonephila clavipes]|nr:hypothetical protein TNCV_634481 [Trichonephila clavipes]